MEENGMRTRSFRDEDYNTRRVFLRSYPLHWGAESETEENKEDAQKSKGAAKDNKEQPGKVANRIIGKKPMKKIVLSLFHWGEERVLVFRRFKHKITIYVVNCVPATLKPPTVLISVK